MSNQVFSDSFKNFFLTEFTKELIRNSAKSKIELKPVRRIEIPRKVERVTKEKKQIAQPMEMSNIPVQKIETKPAISPFVPEIKTFSKPVSSVRAPPILRIPEPRLPEAFQYLKPTATFIDINLGKLNPLVRDSNVRIIECNGPDEQIIVEGTMGRKLTNTILNKDEIDDIIKKFSEISKIPISTGIHKVVAGRFIFMAIISEIVHPKFVIKKLL